jgi:hypothetical protein
LRCARYRSGGRTPQQGGSFSLVTATWHQETAPKPHRLEEYS